MDESQKHCVKEDKHKRLSTVYSPSYEILEKAKLQ